MRINSFLVQGDGSALAGAKGMNSLASLALNALVLMSLGADHPKLIDTVRKAGIKCPVYLTETYGILGYDDESGRHVELMEKGRGSEYGFCGGSGGQGCLVVAYSDGGGDDGSCSVAVGHDASLIPKDVSSIMVVADGSGAFSKVAGEVPVHYGGITKEAWRVLSEEEGGGVERVPYFWVAAGKADGEPVGISTFTGDASSATESLLSKLPTTESGGRLRPSGSVGLFPCFTRGVNQYGSEDVEVNAIAGSMPKTASPLRIYGMFAHGELGPSSFSGFVNNAREGIECKQHGGTSILSIHTVEDS